MSSDVGPLVAALEAAGVDGFWKLYDLASNADALLPILAAHAGPAARATALRVLRGVCSWWYMDPGESESDFEGSCGVAWAMTDGGLEENGMKFCPRCGGEIEFVQPEDDDASEILRHDDLLAPEVPDAC